MKDDGIPDSLSLPSPLSPSPRPSFASRLLFQLRAWLGQPRLWAFLFHVRTRYALTWLLAALVASGAICFSWNVFADTARNDGDLGHTYIDFGGQYLMGRMLVKGHGQHLYHRNFQRSVLTEVYPRTDENPTQEQSDVESLMVSLMGEDDRRAAETIGLSVLPLGATGILDIPPSLEVFRKVSVPHPIHQVVTASVPLAASDPLSATLLTEYARAAWPIDRIQNAAILRVGGPLYPPTHAFLFYPLATFSPRQAYRIDQVIGLLMGFLAGLAMQQLSRGRFWWPLAVALVIVFPGFIGALNLGQNSALTLNILFWGWVLISRDRPVLGGLVWGLLVYKPVWLVAFFLVPLLGGRWRVCLAMILSATGLALMTLPIVGWQTWLDWFRVTQEASATYLVDTNWIHLSRDVLSIPRRWLDFNAPSVVRRTDLSAALIGWGLLIAYLEMTFRTAALRQHQTRDLTGAIPAFLILGAWMSCFHFMYYDVLLAAFPVFLFFTEPGIYLERRFIMFVLLGNGWKDANFEHYYEPRLPRAYPSSFLSPEATARSVWVLNRMVPSLVVLLLIGEYLLPACGATGQPWGTYVVMLFWLWCGWLWLRIP